MTNAWPLVGTVVGNTSTYEFTFILKRFKSRVGDIVCVPMAIPDETYSHTNDVIIWGRIIGIERHNPFFPYESGQELTDADLQAYETVLSTSRDLLQASVIVLGYTAAGDQGYDLFPLTYPIQPAATVRSPSSDAVILFLQGQQKEKTAISIGHLISRQDVDVSLDGDALVARHMAILSMTGGGKTVAARRVIKELGDVGYPLLILDPHGDYLGLWKNRDRFPNTEIQVFYPHISISEQDLHVLNALIAKMTGGITPAQREVLDWALGEVQVSEGTTILDYIDRVLRKVQQAPFAGADRRKKGEADAAEPAYTLDSRLKSTPGPLKRALGQVREKLVAMERANEQLRKRLSDFPWKGLPSPSSDPGAIVAPRQISILYLGGYDHLTQSTMVSIVLEKLFEHRANLTNVIPPFFTVFEEAHNFIPSAAEGQADTPSVETVRKIITEGRKFGTGLLLISQRPSRLDATILSQCNSFLILRLVNPKDQQFVRQVMENLSEADARMLPGFGPGQGIVSGQAVRFPLLVKIRRDEDLEGNVLGDERFIKQAQEWSRSAAGLAHLESKAAETALADLPKRGPGRPRKSI